MSVSRVRENRTHGSMRRREATPGPVGQAARSWPPPADPTQRQLRARHSLLPGEPARDGLSARRRPRGRAPSPRPRRRPSKRPANSAGPEPALVRACCVYGQGQGRLGHPAARRTTRDRPVPTRRRSRSPRTPGGGGVEADVATDYGELSGSAAQRCRAPGTAASGHRESAGLRHGGLADARD
jgi:hypothetical protein